MIKALAKNSLHERLSQYAPLSIKHLHEERLWQPFLNFLIEKNKKIDWFLPIHLLNWLAKEGSRPVSTFIIQELANASLVLWSLSGFEHIHAKGMMLQLVLSENEAFGLWKNVKAEEGSKLVRFILKESTSKDRYTISNIVGSWHGVSWLPIPE